MVLDFRLRTGPNPLGRQVSLTPMLRRLLLTYLAILVSACWTHRAPAASAFEPVLIKGHPAHPTRILARRTEGWSASAQSTVLSATGLTVVRTSAFVPGLVVLDVEPAVASMQSSGATVAAQAVSLPSDEALLARIEALRASGIFDYAEPDYLVFSDAVPNDSAFTNGTLWGLRNTGQSGGAAGVDIGAEAAWDVTKGSTNVIVAVIDTGIRLTHLDLAAQLWRNPGEIAGNGRDDDNNGYVDDVHGINAIANDGDPVDDVGHGTHVAGTIGAAANNGQPMVGVAWQVRLMACKFISDESDGLTSDAIECVNYAVARGARILNCSWGGDGYSRSLYDTLAAARSAGALVVASAGNDGIDNDFSPHYPSSYDLDNIISVAAINRQGGLAGFSNYGVTSVDLAAPGDSIYSTDNVSDTSYRTASGTSMAAPHVSGVAALVRAREPAIALADLRDRLLRTVVPAGSLASRVATGGRVHAHRALTMGPDGQLEIAIAPTDDELLTGGRDLVVTVRVTDLTGVRGATVSATVSTGGTLVFRDDGIAPDVTADDADYTAVVAVPQGASQLVLGVTASAPAKVSVSETITYEVQPPPTNDMFAARKALSGTSVFEAGTNRGASREPGEPAHAGKSGGTSVWWTWTAPGDGTVTIDTEGSTFDTTLGVYTGSAVDALTEIASNDDINGPNQPSRVSFAVVSGTTYQIAVDGFGGATGDLYLRINAALSPANDRFDRAIVLAGSSVVVAGSTRNCTLEPGEPVHVSDGNELVVGSTWWIWTAPSDGIATVSATATDWPGANLMVYAGDRLDALVRGPRSFGAAAGQTYLFVGTRLNGSAGVDFTLSVNLVPGPANDLFARRIATAGDEVVLRGNLSGASREPGEPGLPGPGQGTTLWWSWTPASSGTARLLTTGSVGRPTVGVYTGDAVSALREITADLDGFGDPNYAYLTWRAEAGTAYHIAVDSYAAATDVVLGIVVLPPPVNDDFAHRIQLSGTSVSVAASNDGAGREVGEPDHLGGIPPPPRPAGATLWWSWTAPADGTAVFEGDGIVAVYTGASIDALTPVLDADQVAYSFRTVVTRVAAGVEYQVACDGYGYARGVLPLSIEWHESPPNDMFADRIVLSGTSAALVGDAAYATLEPGERDQPYSYQKGTLWWTWTAPITGTVVLTTTTEQIVAVHTGGSVSTLASVVSPTQLAPGYDSLRFSATAGQAYEIAVTPLVRPNAPVAIQLECLVPPPNDMFAARSALPGSSGRVTAANGGATSEPGEPYTGGSGRSIWWTWTTPSAGVASISLGGSAIEAVVRVFEGTSLSALSVVAEGRTATVYEGERAARWVARAGATYVVVVDSRAQATGAIALSYALAVPPANDAFARRATLSGPSFQVTGDNFGSTAEPGEPPANPYFAAQSSVWWKWTAPSRGTLRLEATGESYQTLAVFSGSTLGSLVRSPDADGSSGAVTVHVEAGVEYQVCADTHASRGDMFVLTGVLHAAPANDMFADRRVLQGADASDTGTLLWSTAEIDESIHGAESGYGSVWWSWTAPRSGPVVLTTRGAQFDHGVDVLQGTAVAQLTRVVSGVGFGGRGLGTQFNATAGSTYHIAVALYYNVLVGGPVTVRVEQPDVAANDRFADRAVLAGASGQVAGTSIGAGLEPNETHPGTGDNPRASVWWSWTAPSSGTVTFTQTGADIAWTRLRGYTGATIDALTEVPNAFGYNSSDLRFHAVAGTTYLIAHLDLSAASVGGPYAFDFRLEDGPVNDMFADAVRIDGASARIEGTTRLATREIGEPVVHSGGTTTSMWWRWTAPRSGMLVLDLDPGEQAGHLLLATGSHPGALVWEADAGGYVSGRLRIRFVVTAGRDYVIRVDGIQGAIDRFTLALDLVDPPANDAFAARIALSGADVMMTGDNRGASVESGEPYISSHPPRATMWWSWTAPASGRTVITTIGSAIGTKFAVFTGTVIGALTLVDSTIDSDRSGNAVVLDAVAGTVYQIVVDGVDGDVGAISMHLVMPEVPVNDLFANRTPLAGESVVAHGSTLGAAREAGEPQHAGYARGCTLWWSWTAPRDGYVRIRTAGSSLDTLAAVYTGDALDALLVRQSQARGDLPSGEREVDLDLGVTAGTTYQIAVQGFGSVIGDVTLALDMYLVPEVAVASAVPELVAGAAGGLEASVQGGTVLSYQWFKDGVAIPGATDSTLGFASLQPFHSGLYSVRITTAYYTVTSEPRVVDVPTPTASAARVLNLSTRALCQTGENVLIPGFYIQGTGTKRLLMRAVGPELAKFGVGNFLPDPQLVLRRASDKEIVATNDDWGDGPADDIRAAARAVYAFGLTDGSASAALLVDLPAGGYTITASGKGEETGVSIVELYEIAGASESTRLVNISNRGHVGVGGNIMIPGFVVSEEGSRTFLVRVVGPSLARFGVQGVLVDPMLEIYRRRPGTAIDDLILTNDTWGENGDAAAIKSTATAVQAFSLLEGSQDAAFVVTLPPGAYTVNAKGVGDTTGVAIVEVYLVP